MNPRPIGRAPGSAGVSSSNPLDCRVRLGGGGSSKSGADGVNDSSAKAGYATAATSIEPAASNEQIPAINFAVCILPRETLPTVPTEVRRINPFRVDNLLKNLMNLSSDFE